jgi:(S)-2-hydroxyglutarate dehydrogenase
LKLQNSRYNIAIVGGGILGASIAYFLSSITSSSIILIEQEKSVAFHTSSRNTGKVHAPFLYDPVKKKFFAKAASLGFEMWKEYCKLKSLPFVQDGVIEVAISDNGIDRLNKYLVWGEANGLRRDKDVWLLDKSQVKQIEPNVKCVSAILCEKDASVNYGLITESLIQDAQSFGCEILLNSRVKKILYLDSKTVNVEMLITNGRKENTIATKFLINAAGGNAVDIAHSLGIAKEYTDLHFRGEYWQAPPQYHDLTNRSVYSVPKYPEYPFLDPHWIVRIDGTREVGPNAVPVFGPYAYNWTKNTRYLIPKILESIRSPGTYKILFDRQFLSLLSHEVKSSLSKPVMINRVTEFLPQIKASSFKKRGTAGIRSMLIDRDGKFVSDTMVIKENYSMHILNYNSPGATGSLPMGAAIVDELLHCGIIMDDRGKKDGEKNSIWDIQKISNEMKLNDIK